MREDVIGKAGTVKAFFRRTGSVFVSNSFQRARIGNNAVGFAFLCKKRKRKGQEYIKEESQGINYSIKLSILSIFFSEYFPDST